MNIDTPVNATEPTKVKSGFLSSEFYLALANNIVGILVLLGYLQAENADELGKALAAVIAGLMILVSTTIYLYSRIVLKREAIKGGGSTDDLLDQYGLEQPVGQGGTYVR